jgi:ferredoxin
MEGSPRRQPWVWIYRKTSRRAAKEFAARVFFRPCQGSPMFSRSFPRLAPRAAFCRCSAAFSFPPKFVWEKGLAMSGGGGQYCFTKKVHFMADVANKYPENTGGKYYVDNQCIDCDLCRETAPDNFKRNDDGGYSFVYKQPENPDEEARCKEAKEGCPVEAIGDNGG